MKNSSSSPPRAGWHRVTLPLAAAVLCALTACSQQVDNTPAAEMAQSTAPSLDWEMQWAQAALERNPTLEVVNADRELRAFTVRDRSSSTTAQVQLAQIVATPMAFLAPPSAVAPDTSETEPVAAPEPESEPAAPEEERLADTSAEPAAPAYTIDRSGGRTKVTGDGISVIYGDGEPGARSAAAPASQSLRPYTIDRSSGLVRVSGQGFSVEASGQPRPKTVASSNPVGAEIEPVICEGRRVMQLDNRVLRVDGDALTARGGCELYITNSTIVASGTGVVIGDATVHISNSRIEGGLASFEAKEQAKVILQGSTLNGLPRRNQRALVQDQGGNSYQ